MPAIFALSLILADQAGKYSVRHGGGFYICNKGIAFGFGLPSILFWIMWLAVITFILMQIFNFKLSIFNQLSISNSSMSKPALYLILAGAISNIIDRLYFGCVIDFIKLPYWPVFNPADTFIVIGVIISVWHLTRPKQIL